MSTKAMKKSDLSCCIDYFTVILQAVVLDALSESALDSRVIGFDKVVFDELDYQRRLP